MPQDAFAVAEGAPSSAGADRTTSATHLIEADDNAVSLVTAGGRFRAPALVVELLYSTSKLLRLAQAETTVTPSYS